MKYEVVVRMKEEPCLFVETNSAERAKELCERKWELMTKSEKTRFIMKAIDEGGVEFVEPVEYD